MLAWPKRSVEQFGGGPEHKAERIIWRDER